MVRGTSVARQRACLAQAPKPTRGSTTPTPVKDLRHIQSQVQTIILFDGGLQTRRRFGKILTGKANNTKDGNVSHARSQGCCKGNSLYPAHSRVSSQSRFHRPPVVTKFFRVLDEHTSQFLLR